MRKERVFYLDFVRVIAFLLIIIFHFNISVGVRNLGNITILVNDFANGNLAHIGVPLFFIISGIALSITIKDGSFKCFEFYKKRFFSIYPMFWLGYALVFLYYFFRYKTIHPFTVPTNPLYFVLTILGLDGYTSSFLTNYYLIGEWFLGCIVLMYLLFPILYHGVSKYPFFCWIPVLLIYFVLVFQYCLFTDPTQNVLLRLPEFLFGIYYGKYVKRINVYAFLIFLLILVTMLFIPISCMPQMVKITIIGISSFMVLAYVGRKISNVTFKTIVTWISNYSYSVYLLHHVISEQIISTYEGKVYSNIEIVVLFVLVLILDILGGWGLCKLCKMISSMKIWSKGY